MAWPSIMLQLVNWWNCRLQTIKTSQAKAAVFRPHPRPLSTPTLDRGPYDDGVRSIPAQELELRRCLGSVICRWMLSRYLEYPHVHFFSTITLALALLITLALALLSPISHGGGSLSAVLPVVFLLEVEFKVARWRPAPERHSIHTIRIMTPFEFEHPSPSPRGSSTRVNAVKYRNTQRPLPSFSAAFVSGFIDIDNSSADSFIRITSLSCRAVSGSWALSGHDVISSANFARPAGSDTVAGDGGADGVYAPGDGVADGVYAGDDLCVRT
ncbi:hypothetical protein CPB84DRAFT_1748886 [Gymnopilus junonius]|uniref:Uncharacterized protein n=1 Tax=Gymnopilus junonius TaxID=109634 RepID=A0A9P5TK75_GYMJU|nr:hypothetical protein CPB84DRAFT_1748886 [Gymnopilus junonius]